MRISDWSSDVCSSDLADAVDAVDLGDGADQQAQVGHFSLTVRPAIRVDVLAEQVDLPHALRGELGDFHQHVLERPADLLAAGVGPPPERPVLLPPLPPRDQGPTAPRARFRHALAPLPPAAATASAPPPPTHLPHPY